MPSVGGSTVMHIQLATGATFLDPAGRSRIGDGVTDCWENLNIAANDSIITYNKLFIYFFLYT